MRKEMTVAILLELKENLSRESKKLNTAAGEIQRSMHKISDTISRVQRVFKAFMGAAVVAGIAATIKSLINYGDEIDKVSKRIGISAETLSRWRLAIEEAGADMRGFARSMRFLTRSIYQAARGEGEAARVFQALGISVKDTQGNIKSAEQVLLELADAMQQIPDGTTRAYVALTLLGSEAGTRLVPLLMQGSAALQDLAVKSEIFGVAMSENFASALAGVKDSITELTTAIKGAVLRAFVPSTGMVNQFADNIRSLSLVIAKAGLYISLALAKVREKFNEVIVAVLSYIIRALQALAGLSKFVQRVFHVNIIAELQAVKELYADLAAHWRDETEDIKKEIDDFNKKVQGLSKSLDALEKPRKIRIDLEALKKLAETKEKAEKKAQEATKPARTLDLSALARQQASTLSEIASSISSLSSATGAIREVTENILRLTGIVAEATTGIGAIVAAILETLASLDTIVQTLQEFRDKILTNLENLHVYLQQFVSMLIELIIALPAALQTALIRYYASGAWIKALAQGIAAGIKDLFTSLKSLFNIFSFQTGGYVTQTGLAVVHRGERIIPRGGINEGEPAPSVTINIHMGIVSSLEVAKETSKLIEQATRRSIWAGR